MCFSLNITGATGNEDDVDDSDVEIESDRDSFLIDITMVQVLRGVFKSCQIAFKQTRLSRKEFRKRRDTVESRFVCAMKFMWRVKIAQVDVFTDVHLFYGTRGQSASHKWVTGTLKFVTSRIVPDTRDSWSYGNCVHPTKILQ